MKKLVILWTTAEKETAQKMIFPYAKNSLLHGWWEQVTLILWGASTKLLASDEELQKEILKLKEHGVKLESCKWCAEQFGVTEIIEQLGFDNKFMGTVLTDYLKKDEKLLTI